MLETDRLRLRQWKDSDFAVFAEMSADDEVMAYFPKHLSLDESKALAMKLQSIIEGKGWGLWAVALKDSDAFIGFVGLHEREDSLPFSPCVEIAWRLSKIYWGYGYATEAANAAVNFAFETLKLDEIVSFTACVNAKSQLVMERLNMVNMQNNFYHPALEPDHELAEHVFYKMTREEWVKR
ncbi:MAG: GNAT family N-acetyltransferase [Psychrobacter sp.]|uniref:GNAT family N-acetyltransferase n=2 Tax=Psychrobacter sp. TaxID=56811 RepID=UPI002649F3EE|nr:GNAT family N-acetyltransferase [Psychrobacter sp.]MDN6275948.1 GNAT family N-acetyltransferase [Psychrobacter sp.]MDN6308372.1 GNAT family N-acetyltransferase [Psychrobacter sp.]